MLKYVTFVILTLLMVPTASAWTLPDSDVCNIGEQLQYLEDREESYGPEQILHDGLHWRELVDDNFSQGFNRSAWWLKFSIANPTAHSQERLLEIGYPMLDQVHVYVYSGGRQISQFLLGDKLPYSMRPLDHHHFIIPVNWEPRQSLDFLIYVKSSGSVYAPLTLWKRSAFISYDSKRTFGQSLYLGALGIFVIYNLLLFLAVKDRSYLYFVCAEGFVLLFLSSRMGLTFRYLWPNAIIWNDRAIPVCISGVFLFAALFLNKIFRLNEVSKSWERASLGFAGLGLLCMGVAFILPYHTALKLALIYSSISICSAFIAGGLCWRRGISAARLYTSAFAITLICFMPIMLSVADLVPLNYVTAYAHYVGAMVGALMLSFALTERINDDRRLRSEAQQLELDTTTRANTELERIIQERTHEKQVLNERLWLLSNTDQLTGVKNRRYLDQCLAEECSRSEEKKRSVAVVLIDIDFFKRVNDTYGHAAGDACLSEVARRLAASVMRPGDEVARYGGEEFCVVLPEIDAKGALTVAERMRKAIASLPFCYEDCDLDVTISIGVAAIIPGPGRGPDHVLQLADQALYVAKENGRNRVCTAPASNPLLASSFERSDGAARTNGQEGEKC